MTPFFIQNRRLGIILGLLCLILGVVGILTASVHMAVFLWFLMDAPVQSRFPALLIFGGTIIVLLFAIMRLFDPPCIPANEEESDAIENRPYIRVPRDEP